jgi:excisionase family DNA binding protein
MRNSMRISRICMRIFARLSTNMHLRYKDMAKRLGISERTLKTWTSKRLIPFIKVQRLVLFDPAKVESALSRFERTQRGTL